jgi:hypothetical protein
MRCSWLPVGGHVKIWLRKHNTGKHKETTTLIKQNTSVVISRVHKEQIKMAKPFSIEKFLHIFKIKIFQANGKLRTKAYVIYSRNIIGQLLKHLWLYNKNIVTFSSIKEREKK